MVFDPYAELANAIVLSAKDDYLKAVTVLRKKFGNDKSIDELKTAAEEDMEKRKKELEEENTKRSAAGEYQRSFKHTSVDRAVLTIEDVDKFIGSPWYHFLTNLDESVFKAHLRQIGG